MHPLLRKFIAIISLLIIAIASVAAWFFIELVFDGCCGARANYSNDGAQSLMHFAAYAVALILSYLLIKWGFKRRQ